MSALTDLPMRTVAEEAGCPLTITEFLPATGLVATGGRALPKLTESRGGRPFGVQLYGRDADTMGRAAARAVQMGAALVDINMGCPTRKVTGGVCGAALMREPELAAELVAAVREGVRGGAAVTVKMRSGWDAEHKNAPQLAERLVAAGAEAIAVHGRTRAQRFRGPVDLEVIAQVKQAVAVPVIANGDIVDVPSLQRTLAVTGADGAMIGRAALGNPWIFSDVRAWSRGTDPPPPPGREDRIGMFLRHLDLCLEVIEEERRAVIEMRKFARHYLAPLPDGRALFRSVVRLTEARALRELLERSMAPPARGSSARRSG
jgi:nifR3 family TIM-barrel protein